MKKRILSLVLALALCMGLLIVPAGAVNVVSSASNIRFLGMVVDEDGNLWAWGWWTKYTTNTYPFYQKPTKVMTDVAAVSSGGQSHAVIKTDGTLWMWGKNDCGQLGNGTTEDSDELIKVMSDVASVSCGRETTAVVKKDGTLWMWGKNEYGQLGNGTTAQSLIPVKVMEDVVLVSCRGIATAAIKTDGTLWMWGSNTCGQLGNGSAGNSQTRDGGPLQTVPVKVMDDVVDVVAAGSFTHVLKDDGTMWSWGENYLDHGSSKDGGYLGIGWTGNKSIYGYGSTEVYQDVPVKVMDNVVAISQCAAITGDGTLYRWGYNPGNGMNSYSSSPVPVAVLNDVAMIQDNLAVKTDGTVWTIQEKVTMEGNTFTVNETPYTSHDRTFFEPVGEFDDTIEVNLKLNGGNGPSTLRAKWGEPLDAPENPTRKGYLFAGWYTDPSFTTLYNFNNKVTQGFTLYAKWTPISSTATTTNQSTQVITLNGNTITLDAYVLKADSNGGDMTFVKLRDIAALLNSTGAKFNVDWRRGAIYVDTGKAYTTKNGTELKRISGTDGSYKWNTAPVLFNGETRALEGIVITDGRGGGHTFFKLRDLGAAIGFDVGWSAEKGIYIETN